jgi:hypothetical protein
MKKSLVTILGIVMLALVAVPSAQAGNQDTVHFGYKSDEITPQARAKLESLALDIKHLSSVTVTAYVPDAGDVALNQEYATKRVQAVKSFLISQGVSDSIISTQTIPGSISKSRMVELSYGAGAAPAMPAEPMSAPPAPVSSPGAMTPPPPSPVDEPVSATPPPSPVSQEPVITAQPKTYESGITEEDVASGQPNRTPSRWEH